MADTVLVLNRYSVNRLVSSQKASMDQTGQMVQQDHCSTSLVEVYNNPIWKNMDLTELSSYYDNENCQTKYADGDIVIRNQTSFPSPVL